MFDLLAVDKASPAFRNVGNAAEQAGKKTSAFGSLTSTAMKSAAGAIAGIGIGKVLFDAANAASDLNQTVSTSSVIFGRNAGEINRWARTASTSVGLSTRAATEAAIGFGDMFQQLGFSGDAAADMSTSTVQLAADLGAFRNLPTSDVVERITAAFRGEYDSLQLLIPNINAARVEQEAMAATGKTSADALTAQEKAAATLAIVQRDGAKAAGAYAREAGGLAGKQQELSAEWENAQARLGELLVGPMTGAVNLLTNGVIPAFEFTADVVGAAVDIIGDIPTPVLLAVGALGGFAALRGPMSSLLDTVTEGALVAAGNIGRLGGAAGAARVAFAGLVSAAAPLAVMTVLFKAIGDVIEFTQAGDEARETIDALSQSLEGLEGPAQIDANAAAIERLRDKMAESQAIIDEFENMSAVEWAIWGQFALGSDEVHNAEEAVALYRAEILRLEGETAIAAGPGGIPLLGAAFTAAGEMATAAAQTTSEAAADWLESLQGINEGFVDPLATYKDLLGQAEERIRNYATVAAEQTTDATDSWEDYVYDAKVSLDDLAASLQTQLDNQANWRTNLGQIAQWAGEDVAQHLADMGAEGVDIVAQMADGTTAGAQAMREQILREIQQGGAEWTANMDSYMKVMEELGRDGGARTVQGLAAQLNLGTDQVRRIAAAYGLNLAEGINPILAAVGKAQVRPGNGPNFASFAVGGYTGDGAKFEPKGVVHGGEFVFTKEQTRKAGVGQLEVFAKMLDGYASGGFVSSGSVPRPPSTRPAGPPVSTAGDGTMAKAYADVTAWLNANLAGGGVFEGGTGLVAALQFARSQVGKPYIWGGVGPLGYDCSGFMSAITNVIRGKSPYSRVGATSTFPWGGFTSGMGSFTIGSTPNAGGGIGHMAGTLLGVNVESAGGVGVRVGGSARGATDSLFGTRAHLATYDSGGILPPGLTFAMNGTGKNETIRTAEQEAALREPRPITVIAQFGSETIRAQAVRVVEEQRRRDAVNSRSWGR